MEQATADNNVFLWTPHHAAHVVHHADRVCVYVYSTTSRMHWVVDDNNAPTAVHVAECNTAAAAYNLANTDDLIGTVSKILHRFEKDQAQMQDMKSLIACGRE